MRNGQEPSDPYFEELGMRKASTVSDTSMMQESVWNGYHMNPDSRYSVLGVQDAPQEIDNELDQINPWLLTGYQDTDNSPQQFFNYIERESDYERMKNKKIGNRSCLSDKLLEAEFKQCFETNYNNLLSSKLFEFVSNTDMYNRIGNFLTIEIESPDRSESALEKIKHSYWELMHRLKNKINSKDQVTDILHPVVDYSFQ